MSDAESMVTGAPHAAREAKVALAGSPNCGKTALFNAITGGRLKVGNYPGVTVERKEGQALTPGGLRVRLLDLPGTYSLDARTPDEMITRDVLLGHQKSESAPDALVAVADATNLERNLGLVLELRDLGTPALLAINMMDLAAQRGIELDLEALSRELRLPVIPTVAIKGKGVESLLGELDRLTASSPAEGSPRSLWQKPSPAQIRARFAEIDRILQLATRRGAGHHVWTDRIDRVVLHPLWGSLLLLGVLLVMFQAIFSWAEVPKGWIESLVTHLGSAATEFLPEGALTSLLVDGVIAGVGSVLVFLPQILLLFLFILILEDSGYMARAAFLMDRIMGRVGLHGRAFIPLLSSYACAIPGIMAARTIESRRDRLITILVAPLTTCSARLPVYTLLIAAFIPDRPFFGPLGLQGAVMFALYALGILSALAMALLFRSTLLRGPKPALLLELPTYKWPDPKNIALGLLERARIFLRRAGTVILTLSVLLWFVASYPKPPEGATRPPISYSYAGKLGTAIEPFLKPIGFDWRVSVALIPGFAAREVMVSALGTVYAVEAGGDPEKADSALAERLRKDWSLATGLSLLVWYVLAAQCLSTLAVVRRETNSWRWPALMLGYMTALAYLGSFLTYRAATVLWPGL